MCKGNGGKRSKVRGCKWRSCLQWQRHSPERALAFDFGEEQAEISSLAIQERKTFGLTTDGRLALRAERGAGEGERTARDIDCEVSKESSSTYL